VAAAAVLALVATAANGAVAARWIGTSFPGFFVLPEPRDPVGRPDLLERRARWRRRRMDRHRDRRPHGCERRRRLSSRRPALAGPTFTYTLRRGTETRTLALASQRFSAAEWVALFAPAA
jgi:hypothetical protein